MIEFKKKITYTFFVKIMKYGLMFLAISIIFLALYNRNTLQLDLTLENNKITDEFFNSSQILIGPKFLGLDKKKQPYKVSASKAMKVNNKNDIFNLEYPKGEITSSSEIFFLEGKEGVFDKPNQFLKLSGEVVFSDKKKFSFHTSEATMDFKKKIILGKQKVSGKKENSTIFSEGFQIEQKTNKIIFTGKSKLTLSNNNND